MKSSCRALCYVRVSTEEQRESGAGLEAQRSAVLGEVARRGWELVEVVEDGGYSAATLDRPGMTSALERLDRHEADVLVVSKLDRLTRSIKDFGLLAERAHKRGWALVCLDLGVDTTTPAGESVANVVAATAQYERRLIGVRTKEGMAAKRAQGVRLGRPPRLPVETVERVVALREAGLSLRAVAAALDERGVPTAGGGPWRASSVQDVLRSQTASVLSSR